MIILLAMLLLGPASDAIWHAEAYEAILGHNKFWDVPVRVENLHRDLYASAGEFAIEYCEGGIWVGDQIIRRDPADTAPQCVWGNPQEGCHFHHPCIEECGRTAWGCRAEVGACCWITPWLGLACHSCYENGHECLWEEPQPG